MKRIILIGMMASGKSTVGRLVAKRTRWRYIDNDDAVQSLTDRPSPEVFAEDGERSLHEAEAAALLDALRISEPVVIGAAAWVVLDPRCQAALRQEPRVVYLRARPETLHERIGAGAGRRADAVDLEWLQARTRERDGLYRELATLTIDVDRIPPEAIAQRILAAFEPAAVTDSSTTA
jgi:shikimate kinase